MNSLRFSTGSSFAILFLTVACLFLTLANVPFLASKVPILKNKALRLGLDLQGGSYIVFHVDTSTALNEVMESLLSDIRTMLVSGNLSYQSLVLSDQQVVITQKQHPPQTIANAIKAGLSTGRRSFDIVSTKDRVTISMNDLSLQEFQNSMVKQSIEVIRNRINETGVNEPLIQQAGKQRILIQLPGIDDPDRVKRLIGKTAKMTFHLVVSPNQPGGKKLWAWEGTQQKPVWVKRAPEITGEHLLDAQVAFHDGQPVVNFRFDNYGGKNFARITTENVSKAFAIVLDGVVISAPIIEEPILQGQGMISGNFDIPQAQDLAVLLRAGALPAPLNILEERTVGPSLGQDSIAAGKIAFLLAFVTVILFMILSYGLFGLFSTAALIINCFMILGLLSGIGATLTLPGIAGIVLTIGMAVDANVLIFERLRIEIKNTTQSFEKALFNAYKRATRTILDANITTAIAALALYFLGSGPIKGFGVTLGIGIFTSVFSAVFFSRLLMSLAFHKRTSPPKWGLT